MDADLLRQILFSVSSGKVSVEQALESLKHMTTEDIGYAHIDHHRSLRKGFPEVIYGETKTAHQIAGIMERMIPQEKVILVTRIDSKKAKTLVSKFDKAEYHEDARMLVLSTADIPITGKGTILVISAGTSDIPVAKEASLTAKAMGNRVETLFDIGVSGIHRLFAYKERIYSASVLVVVAGMEGALPSVVGGLVDKPVIGVPTSVGYGASLGGLTALFSMLNACSSNVAVVNIDNGFGAGYLASLINRI